MRTWTAISHNSSTGVTKLQAFVGPHDSTPAKALYEDDHLESGSRVVALIAGECESRGFTYDTKPPAKFIHTGGADFPAGF